MGRAALEQLPTSILYFTQIGSSKIALSVSRGVTDVQLFIHENLR